MDSPKTDLSGIPDDWRDAAAIQRAISSLYEQYRSVTEGSVAMYIPELARVNPDQFGIAVTTLDGTTHAAGDALTNFTIQSISKPLVYGLALEECGRDVVLQHVGVEPTGESFNSITLDQRSMRPHNPMVNAGAIAVAGLISGATAADRLRKLLQAFKKFVASDVHVDPAVFLSERDTGDRNRAIAYLMKNFGMIRGDIEDCLDVYFQQCAVLMNCHQVSLIAATLANRGVNPLSRERALMQEYVRDVLSVLFTCGLYDSSGEWAYRIGLPAKSGVGGGIMAVAPGKMGIAVFSPPLDDRGNSVRGIRVCEALSAHFRLSIFET